MISADSNSVHNGFDATKNLRLVLIGKTGTGKSKTGNTILGSVEFRSVTEAASVTGKCQLGRGSRWGRTIQVVDTPGLFDTGLTQDQVADEIRKCVAMSAPGPHAIILVTSIGRFTKEDSDTVDFFRQMFGEDIMNYLIVLFTRRDDLDDEGRTITDYLSDTPRELTKLLQLSSQRHVAFNNKASPDDKDAQVLQLLELVDLVMCQNEGSYYTTAMFQAAEEIMRERAQQLRRQHEKDKSQKTRDVTKLKVDQQNMIYDFHQDLRGVSGKMASLQDREAAVGRREAARLREELVDLRQLVDAMKESHQMQMNAMNRQISRQEAVLAEAPPNFRHEAQQEVCQGKPCLLHKLAQGLRGFMRHVRGAIDWLLGSGPAPAARGPRVNMHELTRLKPRM